MVLRAHLLFRYIWVLLPVLVVAGCEQKPVTENRTEIALFLIRDTVPEDTLEFNNKDLKLVNGIFYFKITAYSGYLKECYPDGSSKAVSGFLKGMQHGKSMSFYAGGQLRDLRMYQQNKAYGRHVGYWENGNLKFAYFYENDKREGLSKQWYENGNPYAFLTFKNDREDGMQRAWRLNGKPYINYEVKDGFRYGLQKSNVCKTLINEKLKTSL